MTQIELTKDNTYHGNLILVTPDYPLMKFPCMKDMQPAIKEQPEIQMNEQAANLLQLILAKIHCKNEIVAVSGFRTQEEQEKIWNDTLAKSGLDFTKKYVAVPRHSEHQTGLAIDLAENKEQIDFICPHFPYTGICGEFRATAPRFGFVERYVSGKEQITGIGAEPWHFRYVGYPHSVIMAEKDIALEEYICFLKETTDLRHPYIYNSSKADKIEISYVFLDGGHSVKLDVSEMSPYMISGTNEGGAILSRWREYYAS